MCAFIKYNAGFGFRSCAFMFIEFRYPVFKTKSCALQYPMLSNKYQILVALDYLP